MDKKDYTKFSKQDDNHVQLEFDLDSGEVKEPPKSKKSTKKSDAKPKVSNGFVVNCSQLNVRKEPKPDSEILCEIKKDSEVKIYTEFNTNNFYKVCTAAGVDGYCIKKFISIKQ